METIVDPQQRADALALYLFSEKQGAIIRDASRAAEPLDLAIDDPNGAVSRIEGGGLSFDPEGFKRFEAQSDATVASQDPATRLSQACIGSGEVSIEAWVRPATLEQAGPERIASLSNSPGYRNLTLSYQLGHYDVRLRTSQTNINGLPATRNADTGLVAIQPTHVVFTFDGQSAKLFLHGQQADTIIVDGKAPNGIQGSLKNWDPSLRLILGNEFGGERAFKGDLYLIAYYSRALSPQEIASLAAQPPPAAQILLDALTRGDDSKP